MMKKFFLFVLLLIGSATVVRAQQKSEPVYRVTESSATNLDAKAQLMLTPLAAEIIVSPEKITHTEREAFAQYTTTDAVISDLDKFRLVAISRAAHKYGADLLVGTVIDIRTIDNVGHFEITVSGYPATYANFRNATQSDIDLAREAQKIDDNEGLKVISGAAEVTRVESK